MTPWRLILEADCHSDLTTEGAAVRWLAAHAELRVLPLVWDGPDEEMPTVTPRPVTECWGAEHQCCFVRTVQALRSLAQRLKGFKSRGSEYDPLLADEMLRHVLSKSVREEIISTDRPGAPLNRKTFGGLRRKVETPVLRSDALELFNDVAREFRAAAVGCHARLLRLHAEALASLVLDDIDPVCGRCGVKLAPTPKGRRSRAKNCSRCSFDLWKEQRSPEEMRAKWKSDQKEKRKKDKAKIQASKSATKRTRTQGRG